nr:tripartite motif-containing protein 16-like [Misgurnus anguillicaudatus]
MAHASFFQDKFSCPVCLDLLKDAVTIPCGHSYCMGCITDCWNKEDEEGVYNSCPQCRHTFYPRPALYKNVMFAEVLEELNNTNRKIIIAGPSDSCFDGPEDVECDICTGRKDKAVKFCLICREYYCQTHFKLHNEFHSSKRHKVTDASGRLKMICPQHDRVLEVFCRTDQQCICLLCVVDDHKNHDSVSAAVERTKKQTLLEGRQRKVQQRIQDSEEEIQELRKAVQSYKRSAQTAIMDSEKIFTELIRSIERHRSEVTQLIRDQEKTAVSRAEGLLKQLEQEMSDLRRRDAELKQLSYIDDHIQFLQSFQSFSAASEFKVSHNITDSHLLSFDDVGKSLSQLKDKVEDFCKDVIETMSVRVTHITILSDEPKTRKEFLKYSSQFTLDSNTVYKHLRLSDWNKTATYTDTDQPYPDHPDRFNYWWQVLCKESVTGRCYWEVEWSGNDGVHVSVSYKSISRKGNGYECVFGGNSQSWSLFCLPTSYFFVHNGKRTKLPVSISCSRIGVFLDHRAGTLAYYRVSDTMTLIHKVQTTFTQPLYPGFLVKNGSTIKL